MAAEYDITHDKGTTFKLFALYKDSAGSVIDLANFTARMQVRKSPDDSDVLLFMTGTTMSGTAGIVHSGSVTGGGSTGEFTVGASTAQTGTGDIRLNAGSTGFTGETGGVYLQFDAVTSANLPTGRHFYDLELIEGTEVTRLVQGRFKTNEEITR